MKRIKYYIVTICLLAAVMPLGVGAAYDFEQNTGLSQTSQSSGYAKQKLFGEGQTLESGLSTILTAAVSLLGIIFLLFIVYGGLMWMTARGNEKRLSTAKAIITDSITGMVILALAYAISYFLISVLF